MHAADAPRSFYVQLNRRALGWLPCLHSSRRPSQGQPPRSMAILALGGIWAPGCKPASSLVIVACSSVLMGNEDTKLGAYWCNARGREKSRG